ncbi:hypothetical protein CVT24_005407 [Panaeolus cyanescens]|uniref:RING-type domain-containing protein n=1 Tax=Panaeolus cyanescens TaxID=181874 RepID=A0A409Y8N9_9AGAR|nr:hypothetical protein CVT24_005407 [Panaeolus cyanescens]
MSTAPQLQLSIQPSTTSFKRSFEQFGVDLGSPVGASNPDASATDARNGNDRSKRARNSITSISEQSTSSSSSSSTDSSAVISQSLPSPSSTSDAASQVLGLTVDSTPIISLSTSFIPPRLPTPDIQDVEMPDYPQQGNNVNPGITSDTHPLLPLDLPAQHALHPSSSQTSPAASRTQSDAQDLYQLSLERFNAFDSEIAVLRLPIDPLPATGTQAHHRSPTPPPTLPPIALSAEQGPLAPFLEEDTIDPDTQASSISMNPRVRYQPERPVFRPLQLHQNYDEDNEEPEVEHDDRGSDSDDPPSRVQSRIHDVFREHLDSALERLRSGSPLVPDLEGDGADVEDEVQDDEEAPGSAIPPHPPTLPPIVMSDLEPLLDDPEADHRGETAPQARSETGSITPRPTESTTSATTRTASNPSLDDHRLPSPLLRELHSWMNEDEMEEGHLAAQDLLLGPFARPSSLLSRSTYVGLPQLDVGGGLGLALEDNDEANGAQIDPQTTRPSQEAQLSNSHTQRQERNRPQSSRPTLLARLLFDAENERNAAPSIPTFRSRSRRFQNSASLFSEALAEARARREMEEIRASRHERAFLQNRPDLPTRTRNRSVSRLLNHRELESPSSGDFIFDADQIMSAWSGAEDAPRRRPGRWGERIETQRESERGTGGWMSLGIGRFGDSRTAHSGWTRARSNSRQRVGEPSSSRNASTSRSSVTAVGGLGDDPTDDATAQGRDTVSLSADFRTELSMLRETMAGLTRTLETAVGASSSQSGNTPATSSTAPPLPTRRASGRLSSQDDRSGADFIGRTRESRRSDNEERRGSSPPRRGMALNEESFLEFLSTIYDPVSGGPGDPLMRSRSRTATSAQMNFGANFGDSAVRGEGADEEHASRDRQTSPGPGGRSARGIVISDLDGHNGAIPDRLDMNIALGAGAAPAAPTARPSLSTSMTSRPHRFSWLGRRRDRSLTDVISGLLPSSPTSPSSGISHSPLTSSSTSLHLPPSSFLDEPLRRRRPFTEEDESDMDVDYEMGMDSMDTSSSFDRPTLPIISEPSHHERGPFNNPFTRLSESGFLLRTPSSPIEFRRHSSHSFPGEMSDFNNHGTLDAASDGADSTDVSNSHYAHTHNLQHHRHMVSISPPQPPSLPPPDLGRPLSPTPIPSSADNSYHVVDEPQRIETSRNGPPSAIHTTSNPYSRVSMDSGFTYQNLVSPPLPPPSTTPLEYQDYQSSFFPVQHSPSDIYDGQESDGSNPEPLRFENTVRPRRRPPRYTPDIVPPNQARATDNPFVRREPNHSRDNSGGTWQRGQNPRPTLPSVFGNAPVDTSTFAPGPFRNTVAHMMSERVGNRPQTQPGRPHYHPQPTTIPPIIFDHSYDNPHHSRMPDQDVPRHTRTASVTEPADRMGSLRRSLNEFEQRIFHRPSLSATSTASSFASARGAALLNQEANNNTNNLHSYVHHHHNHHPHTSSSTSVNQQPTNNWSGDPSATIRPSAPLSRRLPRPYTSSASDMHRLLTERVRLDGSRLESTAQAPHLTRLPHPTELSGTLRNVPSTSGVNPMRPEPGSDVSRSQQLVDRYRRLHELHADHSYRDRTREQTGTGRNGLGSQRIGEGTRETITPRSAPRWLSGSGSDDSSSSPITFGETPFGEVITAMRGRRGRFSRPEGMSFFGRRRSRQAMGDYMHDDDFDSSYESLLNLAATLGDVRAKSTPEEIINTQETAMYKEWATAESDQRCPICLDDYAQDDMVLKLSNCSHWLHRDCLKQWLQTANTCPVCRKRVDVPSSDSASSSRPRTRRRLSYGASIHRGLSALRRVSDPLQPNGASTSTSGTTAPSHNPPSSSNVSGSQISNISIITPRSQERSSSPPVPTRLLLRRDSTGFSTFHRFFDSP